MEQKGMDESTPVTIEDLDVFLPTEIDPASDLRTTAAEKRSSTRSSTSLGVHPPEAARKEAPRPPTTIVDQDGRRLDLTDFGSTNQVANSSSCSWASSCLNIFKNKRSSIVPENKRCNKQTKIPDLTPRLSHWKIKNTGLDKSTPMPVVALSLSDDATRVAFGGIVGNGVAPVRVCDLKQKKEFIIQRKHLINSLKLFDYPLSWSNQLSSLESKADENFGSGSGAEIAKMPSYGRLCSQSYAVVIADEDSLAIFELPSGNNILCIKQKFKKVTTLDFPNNSEGNSAERVLLAAADAKDIYLYTLSMQDGQIEKWQQIVGDHQEVSDIALTRSEGCPCQQPPGSCVILAVAEKNNRRVTLHFVIPFERPAKKAQKSTQPVLEITQEYRINDIAFSTAPEHRMGKSKDRYEMEAATRLAIGSGTCAQVLSIEWLRPKEQPGYESPSKRGYHSFNSEGSEAFEYHWEWEEIYRVDRKGIIEAVELSKDGEILVIADDSKQVAVFNVVNGSQLHNFKQIDRITGLNLCENARMLAVGGFDRYLVVHDLFSGLEMQCFEEPGKANILSISLSESGSRIAIGTEDKRSIVLEIKEGNSLVTKTLFQSYEGATVKIVHLTKDGNFLATGGFNNCARIYNVEANGVDAPTSIWQKEMDGFVWALYLMRNGDNWKLAVGDWTGAVFVFKMNDDFSSEQQIFYLKMKDRIFSLHISLTGGKLAIGNRDHTASIYDLNSEKPDGKEKQIFQIERSDRVYTVAMSPDEKLLAVAGVDKMVALYEVKGVHLLKEFKRTEPVNIVQFSSDGSILGAVGDDGIAALYDVQSMETILFHKCPAEIKSITFSSMGSMAISSNTGIYLFGKGKTDYGVKARPSFDYAASLFEQPHALEILVKNYPTIPNCRDPQSGDTVLLKAVNERKTDVVEILLTADCTLGLIANYKGISAISSAVTMENKEIVILLLRAIVEKKISNLPGSLDKLTSIQPKPKEDGLTSTQPEAKEGKSVLDQVGEKFPDLYLQFFASLKLEEAGSLVLGDRNMWDLEKVNYLWCDRRAPRGLWWRYSQQVKCDSEKKKSFYHKFKSLCQRRMAIQRAVTCYRVPIQGFSEVIDLGKIVGCAEATSSFDVFGEDTIISEIINFQIRRMRQTMKLQLVLFMTLLFMYITWAYYSAAYLFNEENDTARILAHSLIPFIFPCLVYFLIIEVAEISKSFQTNKIQSYVLSPWNFIDWGAFGISFISLVTFFLELKYTSEFASLAIIFLIFKLMYFARVFERYSLMARTLLRVFLGTNTILLMFSVLVVGFACSFMVLIGSNYLEDGEDENTPGAISFRNILVSSVTMVMLIFGEYGSLEDYLDFQENKVAVLLLMLLIIFAVILLLNVLIAKMGDIYSSVRDNSWYETSMDNAKILIELDKKQKLPPWLHCLKADKQYLMKRARHLPLQDHIQELQDMMESKCSNLSRNQNREKIEDLLQRLKTQMERIDKQIQSLEISSKSTITLVHHTENKMMEKLNHVTEMLNESLRKKRHNRNYRNKIAESLS